jgi:CRP-like cAMP-binding protein
VAAQRQSFGGIRDVRLGTTISSENVPIWALGQVPMTQRADTHSLTASPLSPAVRSAIASPERMRPLAETARYRRGDVICRQGVAADYWYTIIRGVVTRYVIHPDGRRQIIDILLPGDFFGFTLHGDHEATSEAIANETIVLRYPRRRTEQLLSEPGVAWSVCEAMIRALCRLEGHLLVMGRVTAPQKVGSFLLEIERRLAEHQHADIALPVSRYDIADYLGISVETVSRALSDLRHRGCIQLMGPRAIKIIDREALAAGESKSDSTEHLAALLSIMHLKGKRPAA